MRTFSGSWVAALALAAASLSCKSKSAEAPEGAPLELTEADREGTTLKPNDKVTASLGPRKHQAARVVETYGKFALVSFEDDGNDWVSGTFKGWVLQKELTPQGAISNHPVDDTCTFAVNDPVRGRWNTVMKETDGVVKETYGRLAHVDFVNKQSGWTQCKLLKVPVDEGDEASTDSSGSGGQVDAATKCKRGCHSRCHGSRSKAKCVADCRRSCEG
ncbi:MAG: hypothetical protein Q8S33_12025 [Myxococcales bacterium]|nr:hypothetical protein [Myxococcales bacterium]